MSPSPIVRFAAAVACLVGVSSCGTVASCLGMAACLPNYTAPTGPAVANLNFKLDGSVPRVFYEMQIALGADAELKSGQYIGIIRYMAPVTTLETTTATGSRVYIRLIATIPHQRCINVASFVPEAGRTYDISQVPRNGSCAISVRDNQTGSWPSNYQVHDANRAVPFILN